VVTYVTEVIVEIIGDKSTVCQLRPGRGNSEKMPAQVGDEAVPARTDFMNLDNNWSSHKERSRP
jgi:hypothetical protein